VGPEHQTKSRQLIDYLIKGRNSLGRLLPMCCVEVKALGGDS